jgi:glycosyltransferase involved in cell wall biosynthesis
LVIGREEPDKNDFVNPKIVEEYGIGKNVIFLGERYDLPEIYPLMDVFVLPSYREGLTRSIIEAMAEKRAVVATDIRGCREEIENDKNGILVPVKNPKKLAEAIIFILNNPDKAREFGENSRIIVEKCFNEDIVFAKIKKEYQRLINEKIYEEKK